MVKKKIGLEDLGSFVFSTDDNFDTPEYKEKSEDNIPAPKDQHLEAHYSSKGRGGKTVTIVKGFVGTDEDLQKLGKNLKKQCGVGGSVKNNEILIQGDVREKVMQYLKKKGFHIKRVGG